MSLLATHPFELFKNNTRISGQCLFNKSKKVFIRESLTNTGFRDRACTGTLKFIEFAAQEAYDKRLN